MKRGFTLIELLAVIVILAIIALIATPIVLNIIDETKDNASLRSAEFYLDAVENSILMATLNNRRITDGVYNILNTGNICIEEIDNECKEELVIEVKGEKPNKGTISIKDGKIEDISLNLNDKVIVKGENEKLEIMKPEQEETPDIEDEIPTPKSFAEDSWETIAANVKAGNISAYKVGDTKEIALAGFTNEEADSNGLYTVRIANTSTPEECNTEGFSQTACGFVIEFEDIIEKHRMNPSIEVVEGWTTSTNKDGYPASSMYTYVNGTIYNALPEELRKVMIDTYVVSGYGYRDAPNKVSTDKLYLLSPAEIRGKGAIDDTVRSVTRQLDYYKNYKNEDGSIGVTTTNYSGAIKKLNGNAYQWWLRSANSLNDTGFYYVGTNGDWSYYSANAITGVAAAFRIG